MWNTHKPLGGCHDPARDSGHATPSSGICLTPCLLWRPQLTLLDIPVNPVISFSFAPCDGVIPAIGTGHDDQAHPGAPDWHLLRRNGGLPPALSRRRPGKDSQKHKMNSLLGHTMKQIFMWICASMAILSLIHI